VSAFRSFNVPGNLCSPRQSDLSVNDDILSELHRNRLAGGINGGNVMQCAHNQRCASGNCNREGGLRCQASNACGGKSSESTHLLMVRSRIVTAYWTLDLCDAYAPTLSPHGTRPCRQFSGCFLRGFHTSKTEMVCPRVYFAFAAGAHDIARTILRVAKKRAAAVHAFLLVGLGWIEW